MPGAKSIVAAGVATLAIATTAGGAGTTPSWTTYGASTTRTGTAASSASVTHLARRFVVPLTAGITAQVLEANGTFVAATTGGDIVAFGADGFVSWHVHVGQLAHSCQQLNGYGVVGTGVIDQSTGTYYVADAFGRLHAFSLTTGVERTGWPVRVFTDFDRELDWGALTLAAGAVYVPTAAYCDQPGTPGGIYRVDLQSRSVTHWLAVPLDQGGGGGPWGWGGLAYDPAQGLFAGTSGAFSAGSNVGASFTETAGNGDRLLQLSTDLKIQASSHPAGLPDGQDLDFVGSPLLVGSTTSCGRLVVAATKNDTVYGWRESDLAAGWAWKVPIEPYAANDPFVAQLAWSPSTSSIYAVTGTELVRISIGAGCTASVAWRRPLGAHTENGSPTVAGTVVWFANNGTQQLVGYDTTTGKRVQAVPLGGTTLEAPTIVGGRLVVGTFDGIVEGFSTGRGGPATQALRAPIVWGSASAGWQSRSDGVYATGDGGKHWAKIYPHPALAILPTSATSGVLATGFAPGTCMCATRQLWTTDGGRTWHDTKTLSSAFAGSGGNVYSWQNATLRLLAPLPRTATGDRLAAGVVATAAGGTIVAAAPVAGGLVALVSNRVAGQGWDNAPRVIVAHGATARVVTLPRQPGSPLVTSITARGARVAVTATDFTQQPARTLSWSSTDSGSTWTVG